MIIADTSIWIEYLRGRNPEITTSLKTRLRKRKVVAISAVFGELLQGVKNKREREIVQSFWDNLPHVNEDNLFIKAGQLSNQYKFSAHGVGLIDAYILAAALEHDLSIWTLDKKLDRIVEEVWF